MKKTQVISLFQLGNSKRSIAKLVHTSRNTVDKYIKSYLEVMERINGTNDNVEIVHL